MGLFDFFRKKTNRENLPTAVGHQAVDSHEFLLTTLQQRITDMGHKVDRNAQSSTLLVNAQIEISITIIRSATVNPSIIHLLVETDSRDYFATAVIENIAGIGATVQDRVDSALKNYLNTTFLPIVESFENTHKSDLDFVAEVDGDDVLFHPVLGTLTLQGRWKSALDNELFFDLLKEELKFIIEDQKFNWLKIYVSRQKDGKITGECLFNNEPWIQGFEVVSDYTRSWDEDSSFLGQKRFMMFRRCDV